MEIELELEMEMEMEMEHVLLLSLNQQTQSLAGTSGQKWLKCRSGACVLQN